MFSSLFLNQERTFVVYYMLIFILIFIVFNIKFVTEEVCIFICFFGILNLISITLIKFARQGLQFKWQKTILWFFSKFSFLYLIGFITNITNSVTNDFSYSILKLFSYSNKNYISFFFSNIIFKKISKLNFFFKENYNKYVKKYSFILN